MNLKARTRFWRDLFLFVAFLIFMQPALTGIAVHEWFAAAAILTFLIHVLSQWDWIVAVGKRFFQKFGSGRIEVIYYMAW